MCTKLVKVRVNLYFQQKTVAGKIIAAMLSEKQRGNTNNDQCLSLAPIRYRRSPFNMRCRLSRKILVNSQVNYMFQKKVSKKKSFVVKPNKYFKLPQAAIEAPLKSKRGMLGTI